MAHESRLLNFHEFCKPVDVMLGIFTLQTLANAIRIRDHVFVLVFWCVGDFLVFTERQFPNNCQHVIIKCCDLEAEEQIYRTKQNTKCQAYKPRGEQMVGDEVDSQVGAGPCTVMKAC